MSVSNCPKCHKRTLESSERMDVCTSCGYFFYYRDAHADGDHNQEGYDRSYIKDQTQ